MDRKLSSATRSSAATDARIGVMVVEIVCAVSVAVEADAEWLRITWFPESTTRRTHHDKMMSSSGVLREMRYHDHISNWILSHETSSSRRTAMMMVMI